MKYCSQSQFEGSIDVKKPVSMFVFAGELSGDMHGGRLIRALKQEIEHLTVSGVGGPEMRSQEIDNVLRMEDFEVMGFSDVLASLPRLWRQFNVIRDHLLEHSPDVAIFIDSPSLSLRMARVLRKRGYKGKIIQYICPTVWAWGKHRIQEMANHFDLLLTIYPFEAAYFANVSLPVKYVGNPVQEMIRQYNYDTDWKKILRVKATDHLIALFPGSRGAEIRRNLPKQLEAAKLLQKQYPEATFAISCAHDRNMPLVKDILFKSHLLNNKSFFLVPKAYSYDLMHTCRSAIAKSGTVTLELALHKCPTVVVYELTLLNRFMAKYVLGVNLPYYCIVNILGNRSIFPEFIERGYTPENLYLQLKTMHARGPEREKCLAGCQEIQALLESGSASEQAAQAIADIIGCSRRSILS